MTPRQRILSVLKGELPDQVPFTIKTPNPPRGQLERQLRNKGLALCTDRMVFTTRRPNVEVYQHEFVRDGRELVKETFRTPVGQVSQTWALGGGYGSKRLLEHLIKQPSDYATVEFMIRDEVYRAHHDEFLREVELIGEDGFVFAGWMPPSPMVVMMWQYLGPERFSLHMVDCPEQFFSLYECLRQRQREQYGLCAQSPALVIHSEENLTADMIGLERFVKYCIPCYKEFAACLHESGKLFATHMDGRMKILAAALAESDIDIIEAFCPVPDGDLELSVARQLWTDKILWLNFPSPVHLRPPQQIAEQTRRILHDVTPGERFLLGITEDIPYGAWQVSLPIIAEIISKEGALPLTHSDGEHDS